MLFPCFVCDRSFKTASARIAHIRQKKDNVHQQYWQREEQRVKQQFSETAHAATRAFSGRAPQLDKPPSVHANDVDQDDLPSSRDMDVDYDGDSDESDSYLEEEGSIVSEPDELVEETEDEAGEGVLAQTMEAILGDLDLESITEVFDFLPDSDLEDAAEGEAGPGPSTAAYRPMGRILADEDAETRTYQWHKTAGRVLRKEPEACARWQALFAGESNSSPAYKPFSSRVDWELAQWAIKEKIHQKSFDRLLNIPEFKERLGLSFSNARSMLETVDAIPERCGKWYKKRLSFKDRPDEYFTIHHRDPIEAIKGLWGDPAFADSLVYKPAKLFRDSKQTEEGRIYSEMWTGGLWNAAQRAIPEGGTVAPVIIASDKTQLTQFSGNKSAYPVYLTLGNIPKSLRRKPNSRACVLVAYLHVDKISKKGLSKSELKVRNYELFHRSMAVVLEPLKAAGNPEGEGVEMVGGDGAVRRVYPILAAYVADYPEQCLVTCTKYGTCPKCQRKADELQLPTPAEPRKQMWTQEIIRHARLVHSGKTSRVHALCMKDDVAGGNFEPFWMGFPLVDIHRCVTPDVLHQLYQGVLKHLIGWVQEIMGEDELDNRIRSLPPASGVRHFKNGISALTQVTGMERKHIARILLSCLVGKIDSRGIIACRSLLHFIILAQYPSQDEATLRYTQFELEIWDKYRSYFMDAGPRDDFNIPKFHSLLHYIESIRWLGTTDNYNTEMFERLHIDFAKEGWRASNKRDHFPQMVRWLSRQEKIASFDFYSHWLEEFPSEDYEEEEMPSEEEMTSGRAGQASRTANSAQLQGQISLAKFPAEPGKSLARILVSHVAPGFLAQLKIFLHSLLPPDQQLSRLEVLQATLPFTSLDVWHQYKLSPSNMFDDDSDRIRECIKALPISKKARIPRFDTVIVLDTDEAESTAVQGCRVARLKIIFRLPERVDRDGFLVPAPSRWPRDPLAYVTWFTRFKTSPDHDTLMYRVEPAKNSKGQAQGSIIPLTDIRQSCMLTPSRATWDKNWTTENILDKCDSFFVNNLQSKYSYETIY